MKISYIAHASLLLETEDTTVVTDPWYKGPAFHNQWHVFPKPVSIDFTNRVTHVVLTHGHEDHFHLPTLALINKEAQVYYPYIWKSGAVKKLKKTGFKDITEVSGFNTVVLGENFTVTYIVSGLDAITVYEYGGMVMVNLNDALNSLNKNFIQLFSEIIRKKWPKIDYLVCGMGGAGYFPNTIHTPYKNDRETAILRERFLAHKFCELVSAFKPLNVIPFVPGFALLEESKQWINEIKFSRNRLDQYYRENFNPKSKIKFLNLLPGDYIEKGNWVKTSPYHLEIKNDNLSHLVREQYAEEIDFCKQFEMKPASIVNELSIGLNSILSVSTADISNELLRKLNFAIAFKDVKLERYIHVYYDKGNMIAEPVEKLPAEANLKITTHTWKLDYAIKNEWGGDIFFIGYGADIEILNQSCLTDNSDILSIRLLSRFPSAAFHMIREPFRAMRYLISNFEFVYLSLALKIASKGNPNKITYNERSIWINKTKAEVCNLCKMPVLSDESAKKLVPVKPVHLNLINN